MRIRSFFDPHKDKEKVDTETTITVPDQSLSVRDILTRFSRGQMVIPPIETGEDDDINADLAQYDDYVDAMESIDLANRSMQQASIKNKEAQEAAKAEVKRSETPATDDSPASA